MTMTTNDPPLYVETIHQLDGFDPDRVRPTVTLDGLLAGSYAAVRRRHAHDRQRDSSGRFLPKTYPISSAAVLVHAIASPPAAAEDSTDGDAEASA